MIESTFNPNTDGLYGLPELDDSTLHEWDSLNQLLSELKQHSATGTGPHNFAIPALLGDGDGIARWVIVLHHVRNLTHVMRLRGELPKIPWCIAARVIEVGSEEIRLGLTTTRRVDLEQVTSAVAELIDEGPNTSIRVQPVLREPTGGTWVSATDAANRLGVKPRTVKHWIELGLVIAKQAETATGKEWLIRTGRPFTNQLIGV